MNRILFLFHFADNKPTLRSLFYLIFCAFHSAHVAHAGWSDISDSPSEWLVDQKVEIFKDGGTTKTYKQTIKILKSSAVADLGTTAFTYHPSNTALGDVTAKTIITRDKTRREYPVDSARIENKPESGLVGYDVSNQVTVPFNNVEMGSELELVYQSKDIRPFIPGAFSESVHFGMVNEKEGDMYQYSSEIPLYIALNDPENYLEASDGELKSIESKNTFSKIYAVGKNSAGKYAITLKLKKSIYKVAVSEERSMIDTKNYPSFTVSTHTDWGAFFRPLIEAHEDVIKQDLPQSFADILKSVDSQDLSDADKIDLVTSQYTDLVRKLTGFGRVEGRYQPRSLSEIATTAYGDSKDNATALTAIFRRLGLKADVAWMTDGTVYHTDSYFNLPDNSFNKAIVRVQAKGKTYWIDPQATASFAKRVPTPLSGKTVFVLDSQSITDSKTPVLVSIPAADPEASGTILERTFKGKVKGHEDEEIIHGRLVKFGYEANSHTGQGRNKKADVIDWEIAQSFAAKDEIISKTVKRADDLRSRISKDQYEYTSELRVRSSEGQSATGSTFRITPWAYIDVLLIQIEDRVSDLYLGDPTTVVSNLFFEGRTLVGTERLGCNLTSDWVDVKVEVEQKPDRVEVRQRYVKKVSYIPNSELHSAQFKLFQNQLRQCLRGGFDLIFNDQVKDESNQDTERKSAAPIVEAPAGLSKPPVWSTREDATTEYQTELRADIDEAGRISKRTQIKIEILKDNGKSAGIQSITYGPKWEEIDPQSIKGTTTVEKDGVTQLFPVSFEIRDLPSGRNGSTETKEIKLTFPQAVVGAKLEYEYSRKDTVPSSSEYYAEEFYFGNRRNEAENKIHLSSKRPLYVTISDDEEGYLEIPTALEKVEPKTKLLMVQGSETKENTDVKGEFFKVKPDAHGNYSLDIRLKRRIFLDTKNQSGAIRVPTVRVSTELDWRGIATKSIDNFEKVLKQELPPLLAGIRDKAVGQRDKAGIAKDLVPIMEAMVAELIHKVRYYGEWISLDGWRAPRDLATVAETKSGDCKDFATALVAMIRSLGLEGLKANVAMVNRSSKDYKSRAYELPRWFTNHAITHIQFQGKTYWVDPTNRTSLVEGVFADIADRAALILNPDALSGTEVPVIGIIPPIDSKTNKMTKIIEYTPLEDKDNNRRQPHRIRGEIDLRGLQSKQFIETALSHSQETVHEQVADWLVPRKDRSQVKVMPKKGYIPADTESETFDASHRIIRDLAYACEMNTDCLEVLTSAGLGIRVPMDSAARSLLVNTKDRVTELDTFRPYTLDVTQIHRGKKVGDHALKLFNKSLASQWLDLSRHAENTSEGLKVRTVVENKKSYLTQEELTSEGFKEFQKLLLGFTDFTFLLEGASSCMNAEVEHRTLQRTSLGAKISKKARTSQMRRVMTKIGLATAKGARYLLE